MKLIYMEATLDYMLTCGKKKEVDKLIANSEHFEMELGNHIVVDETKI